MPSETAAARLIIDTLGSRSFNEYAEAPRHDQLLRRALRRRRVVLKPVGERSLVFVFGGVVVGGMDKVVTTLVSAHSRRITADADLLRRHLRIQELPLPAEEAPVEPEPGQDDRSPEPDEPEAEADEPAVEPVVEPDADLADPAPPEPSAALAAPSSVRAFVVGERVCASLLRLPATVVGDGSSTVRQLVDSHVQARSRHALLAAASAVVADSATAEQLRKRGFSDDHVPISGELVQLRESPEIPAGGLTIDVTAVLPDALHELAVDAMSAVPGLYAAAVDLQVPDLESAEGALVLGVLPEADIGPAHLPAYGEPRDVAGAIAEEILLRASR